MNVNKETSKWFVFLPWLSWGFAALFYSHQYFLRVSVSSLAPSLVSNFHINAEVVGEVASSFYIAFILMQIVSGFLIDRFGVRLMLTLAALMCSGGSLLFSEATTPHMLELGRFITGAGASFSYIGVVTLARAWFSHKNFALVNGLTLSVGTIGAVLGGGPLAYYLQISNWREVIFETSMVSLFLVLVIWLFVRDCPAAKKEKYVAIKFNEFLKHLRGVFFNPQLLFTSMYSSFLFVPVIAFAALWGAPFIATAYGLNNEAANFATSMIFLGVGVGSPLVAWLSNMLQRRVLIMTSSTLGAMIAMLLVLYIHSPIYVVFIILFLLGVFISSFTLSFVIVREITDHCVAATAFSFVNLLKLLGGTVILQLSGWLLQEHWSDYHEGGATIYSLHNFRFALVLIPACLLMAFIASLFIKEPRWIKE